MEEVKLDYATVDPTFGERVSDIEAAIKAGEYAIEDGELRATGERLDDRMFDVSHHRIHAEGGVVLQGERVVLVVEDSSG